MDTFQRIHMDDPGEFRELEHFASDSALVRAFEACVRAQKEAAIPKLKSIFTPHAHAWDEVSKEALDRVLSKSVPINGIRTERHISNVIVFKDKRYTESVSSVAIEQARGELNRIVAAKVRALFVEAGNLRVGSSGFFLYPPKGYMGWHTNWKNPGWRLYLSFTEEPGKSCFRYWDPKTSQIVTVKDQKMNFRLFKVCPERPFWHAIYSDTYRFSLGYKIVTKPPFYRRAWTRLEHLFLKKDA